MKTLSLKTYQALKEAGVECESEFYYVWDYGEKGEQKESISVVYKDEAFVAISYIKGEAIKAYTLQELVPVLKELGKIKGWCKVADNDIGGYREFYVHQFLEISELYATQGMTAVDEYLLNLLK